MEKGTVDGVQRFRPASCLRGRDKRVGGFLQARRIAALARTYPACSGKVTPKTGDLAQGERAA